MFSFCIIRFIAESWSPESIIVNDFAKPIRSQSRRRIRTHIEWKVETHISCACSPTSAATRSFISLAALFVNVIAKIFHGCTASSAKIYAMRWVKTRVFPLPAPAMTRSGPCVCMTASFWRGFIPLINSLEFFTTLSFHKGY